MSSLTVNNKYEITEEQICDILNHLSKFKRDIILYIFKYRVNCNSNTFLDKDIIVSKDSTVSLLGLLNGFFGIRNDLQGPICRNLNDKSEILFSKTPINYANICQNEQQSGRYSGNINIFTVCTILNNLLKTDKEFVENFFIDKIENFIKENVYSLFEFIINIYRYSKYKSIKAILRILYLTKNVHNNGLIDFINGLFILNGGEYFIRFFYEQGIDKINLLEFNVFDLKTNKIVNL